MSERVLCFPSSVLDRAGRFQGVVADRARVRHLLQEVMDPGVLTFRDRADAENDPSYKQLIPYVVLKKGQLYFAYRRTKKAGDARLHHNWSVGVGGHINPIDGEDVWLAYPMGLSRELFEETGLLFKDSSALGQLGANAVINDDSNPVGQVHFGVVHVIGLRVEDDVTLSDPALASPCWKSAGVLRGEASLYENWSRLVIENLLDKA